MNASLPGLRRIAEVVAAALAYAAAGFVLLSPVFDTPWSAVADPAKIATWVLSPNTDIFIWTLSWDWHALTTQPGSLYDANILSPTSGSLAAVFPLFGHLPIFGPLLACTGSGIAAHQLNLLANFALSGAALYALLRHWGTGKLAALFGGFIYALCPGRLYTLAAPSLAAGQYLPLGLLFLDRAVTRRTWSDCGLAALLFIWQAACALAYCFIVPLVVCISVLAVAIPRTTRPATSIVAVCALLVVGSVVAMLEPSYAALVNGSLQLPAALSQAGSATYRSLGSIHSWRNFLVRPGSTGSPNMFSVPLFLGWTTLAYALLGLTVAAHRVPAWCRSMLALTSAAAILLALGPDSHGSSTFWDLLGSWIPATTNSVMPTHFGYVVILAVSILAGFGVDRIVQSLGRGWVARAIVLVALLLSMWELRLIGAGSKLTVVQRSPWPPRIYSLLGRRPRGTVLEFPYRKCAFGSHSTSARAMFNSTSNWHPILNGFGILEQPNQGVIDMLVAALPDPRAIELLARTVDLKHIIFKTSTMTVTERNDILAIDGVREGGYADGQLLVEINADIGADIGPDLAQRFLNLERQPLTLLDNPVGPVPAQGQRVEAQITTASATTFPGLPMQVRARIHNTSNSAWPALGGARDQRVDIAYRWENTNGKPVPESWPDRRIRLPFDLEPGESVTLPLCVSTPPNRGQAELVVGVAQGDNWFAGTLGRVRVDLGAPRHAGHLKQEKQVAPHHPPSDPASGNDGHL